MTEKELIRESHSIVPPDPQLDVWQKSGLGVLGLGIVLFFVAILNGFDGQRNDGVFYLMIGSMTIGGLVYGLRTHLKRPEGIQNNGIMTNGLTSRGTLGWVLGVVITGVYTLYYWFPKSLAGLTVLFDPLSEMIRGRNADVWFVYGALYSLAVLVMGVKAIVKYRHSRYQIIRTCSIIVCQLGLAFIFPYVLQAFYEDSYFAPNYFWPLSYEMLMPSTVTKNLSMESVGLFIVGWSIMMFIIATPFLTYYYGKRWYCSWVCGCGGLANTAGDSWRQNSDKSLKAWKFERYSIYSVLVFVIVMTIMIWTHVHWGWFSFDVSLYTLSWKDGGFEFGTQTLAFGVAVKKIYGFLIGAAFAGVIGVGFYPIMGTRVWCRFGCPQAAILGIIQRFKSRFRITTNGSQCISCGNCSTYCEMGIDVRWYAQRGQDVVRASCVGCGMCSAVCPRGVLNLENGPLENRGGYQIDLMKKLKSKKDVS